MCVFVKFDLSLDRKDVEHDTDDFLVYMNRWYDVEDDEEKKREEDEEKGKIIRYGWFMVRYNKAPSSNFSFFKRKIKGLKFKTNKVYDRPHTILIHYRYLELKTNREDQNR